MFNRERREELQEDSNGQDEPAEMKRDERGNGEGGEDVMQELEKKKKKKKRNQICVTECLMKPITALNTFSLK